MSIENLKQVYNPNEPSVTGDITTNDSIINFNNNVDLVESNNVYVNPFLKNAPVYIVNGIDPNPNAISNNPNARLASESAELKAASLNENEN